jgi:hypothetical protein
MDSARQARDDGLVRGLVWAGLAAGAVYTGVVVVGGAITPGYSHVGQHVSSLYQAGAAAAAPIAAGFVTYNACVVGFGVGVARLASRLGQPRRRIGIAGGVALVLTGAAGLLDVVFPQDPIGAAITTTGTMHIIFAGVASLLTLVTIGLAAAWAVARPSLRRFGWYSVLTLAVIAVSGPVAAIATANLWPTMGLVERVPIFGFVQWAVVCSLVLAGHTRRLRA